MVATINYCPNCNEPSDNPPKELCYGCSRDFDQAGYIHTGEGGAVEAGSVTGTIITITQKAGRMTAETAAAIGKAFRKSKNTLIIIVRRKDQP